MQLKDVSTSKTPESIVSTENHIATQFDGFDWGMAPISHSKFDQFTSWNGEDIRDVSRN